MKYVCLVDYSNSRGASDMGVSPDLGPGYHGIAETGMEPGLNYDQITASTELDALWIVGSNPAARQSIANRNAFIVVQDMFLTETARLAEVFLPVASAYEKSGTVTNVTGEVQKLARAAKAMGPKSDLEIFALLAKEMHEDIGAGKPEAVFQEIRKLVRGYDVLFPIIETGGCRAHHTLEWPGAGRIGARIDSLGAQYALYIWYFRTILNHVELGARVAWNSFSAQLLRGGSAGDRPLERAGQISQ